VAPSSLLISIQPSSGKKSLTAPALLSGGNLVQAVITPDSQTAHFALHSIASGCYGSAGQGAIAPAIDCTIRFEGKNTKGETAEHDFVFKVPVARDGSLASLVDKLIRVTVGVSIKSVPVQKTQFPLEK
jgi:hypothetical protein